MTPGMFNSLLPSASLCVSSEDIPDQCSPSPCNPRGTVRCEDKKGDFLCHCFTGWAGARCEQGTVITSAEVAVAAFAHRLHHTRVTSAAVRMVSVTLLSGRLLTLSRPTGSDMVGSFDRAVFTMSSAGGF